MLNLPRYASFLKSGDSKKACELSSLKKGEFAFTLVEILVTLVIIAGLTSLILPQISRSQDKQQREHFIEKINHQITYARETAISTHVRYVLVLDFKTRESYLQIHKNQQFSRLKGSIAQAITFPDHLTLDLDKETDPQDLYPIDIFSDGSLRLFELYVIYRGDPYRWIITETGQLSLKKNKNNET
jgi:type II secretory pathway pseudopilin PulG